ncbi:hypothetical protein FKV24_012660 [Lysobacter maris]|uniref:Uncharacterized protein n=1 Tax=Marilutibacter maris TaxID=1605891 RepID=A0A508AFT7_9GAMM|nr:hypothetical protein [Lysobacter maris]KAB8180181.1 hypothetical protein FKV24_012660 [Lysobacter maris]
MTSETVASPRAESVVELWGHIGQLEAVLAAANEVLCRHDELDEKQARTDALTSAHYLVQAAQTVADQIAYMAYVR